MSVFWDRQETQTTKSRDAALFRDLKGVLSVAKARAPSLREQLRGVDLGALRTRADLARVPVMRDSSPLCEQNEKLLFGGFFARRSGALKTVSFFDGRGYLPEGNSKDWWRAARALNAAGFAKGDVVINDFDYHAGAFARMVESGANALGCAVLPTHARNVERLVDAIVQLDARAYCGASKRLVDLIKACELRPAAKATLEKAVCFDAASDELSPQTNLRIPRLFSCYAKDELGVVAYQTKAATEAGAEEFIVNEGFIVEIVSPGGDLPLPFGAVGEIIVTRVHPDFPLLRFATGDMASLVLGPSSCGRTNMRLRKIRLRQAPPLMERAPERGCDDHASSSQLSTHKEIAATSRIRRQEGA